MTNVSLNAFITSQFQTLACISYCLFQHKVNLSVLNFGWRFRRGKHNRKTLIGMTKRWLQLPERGGRLIGVLFTVFY